MAEETSELTIERQFALGWIAFLYLKGMSPRDWISEAQATAFEQEIEEMQTLPLDFLKQLTQAGVA